MLTAFLASPVASSWIGRRLGGPILARVFALVIVLVAAFIIFKTWLGM